MNTDKIQGIGTSGFIFNRDGKFLIIRRSLTDDFCAGEWELPGGGVDHGEDPKESIRREVMEEVGIAVHVGHPLTVFNFMMHENGRQKHVAQIVYLCSIKESESVQLSFEHCDYRWVSFRDVENLTIKDMADVVKDMILSVNSHPIVTL